MVHSTPNSFEGKPVDGFFVDLDDLERAAERLRAVGADVDANSVLRYSVSARSAGSEELASALTRLNQASKQALTTLRELSADAADRLSGSARTYRDVESAVAGILTELDRRSSADVTPPSW